MNKGIISLTVVIFMMVVMVLVLALVQSRILLSIQRTKGTADSILSAYNAESEIYDTLARFHMGYPLDESPPTQIRSDGTTITYDLTILGNEEQLTISATLPFATTKLRMSRSITTATSFSSVDIIVSLDCTSSMHECANPDDGEGTECRDSSDPTKTTKFQELRRGTIAFLEGLKSITDVPVRVGVSVFSGDSTWARTAKTVSPPEEEIKPNSTFISLDEIIETIRLNFAGKQPSDSIGCSVIPQEGTSHASSLLFMHTYFANNKPPQSKQVEVLVTDGLPTTSIPITACGSTNFIPAGGDHQLHRCPLFHPFLDQTQIWRCVSDGETFLSGGQNDTATDLTACMITNTERTWNGTDVGNRQPDIDAYVIATFTLPESSKFRHIMTTEPGVFFYDTNNAQDLTTILKDDVINAITKTIDTFTIQRVTH